MKVGIVGCGTIGSELAKACTAKSGSAIELIGIHDKDGEKALALQKSLKNDVPVMGLSELIKKSDLVAEAASASMSSEILKMAIEEKKNVLIMSIGGLIGSEQLLKKAESAGIKVYLPSGALCGIDGLKSAGAGKIDSVTLTTRKPPKGLEGAPYIKEKNIDLSGIRKETVIFEGSAKEAIKGFPANVNVCAALSLAGIGADRTKVRIVTSPDYDKNVHEVEITGDFGRISTRTENLPSKTNPRTSQLAVLSAISTLEGAAKNVRVGT